MNLRQNTKDWPCNNMMIIKQDQDDEQVQPGPNRIVVPNIFLQNLHIFLLFFSKKGQIVAQDHFYFANFHCGYYLK